MDDAQILKLKYASRELKQPINLFIINVAEYIIKRGQIRNLLSSFVSELQGVSSYCDIFECLYLRFGVELNAVIRFLVMTQSYIFYNGNRKNAIIWNKIPCTRTSHSSKNILDGYAIDCQLKC